MKKRRRPPRGDRVGTILDKTPAAYKCRRPRETVEDSLIDAWDEAHHALLSDPEQEILRIDREERRLKSVPHPWMTGSFAMKGGNAVPATRAKSARKALQKFYCKSRCSERDIRKAERYIGSVPETAPGPEPSELLRRHGIFCAGDGSFAFTLSFGFLCLPNKSITRRLSVDIRIIEDAPEGHPAWIAEWTQQTGFGHPIRLSAMGPTPLLAAAAAAKVALELQRAVSPGFSLNKDAGGNLMDILFPDIHGESGECQGKTQNPMLRMSKDEFLSIYHDVEDIEEEEKRIRITKLQQCIKHAINKITKKK